MKERETTGSDTVCLEGAGANCVNETNVAMKVVEERILRRAIETIEKEFGEEEAVRAGVEETVGASDPIVRVPDENDKLIEISNWTAFGVSSGVCTNDFLRMQKVIRGLNVGTVNIWEVPGYRIEMSPFGGIKDSGNGYKEGVIEAMKSFTNVKTFSLPWN